MNSASPSASTPPYTLETTAQLAGLLPEVLVEYCRLGVLGPRFAAATGARLEFDDETVYELRRVQRLSLRHEVGRTALPLLADLLREVDRLRAELRRRRAP